MSETPEQPAPEAQADRGPLLILVKKKKARRSHGGAHGGSWKIAYADFVTAMMAFFLLMWLLSSTGVGDLQGIADYFNRPLSGIMQQGPGSTVTTAPIAPPIAPPDKQAEEKAKLKNLKDKIDDLIQKSAKLSQFKNQIKVEITSEGLRIQILDDKNHPMFDKGDSDLKNYTQEILRQIGVTLNDVPNPISITGHTDSLTYKNGAAGYSNWELSAERANAARRELIVGGLHEKKVIQVRGLADAIPLFPKDLDNPGNRRISIVVLNTETVNNILGKNDKQTIEVGPSAPLVIPSGAVPAAGPPTAAPAASAPGKLAEPPAKKG